MYCVEEFDEYWVSKSAFKDNSIEKEKHKNFHGNDYSTGVKIKTENEICMSSLSEMFDFVGYNSSHKDGSASFCSKPECVAELKNRDAETITLKYCQSDNYHKVTYIKHRKGGYTVSNSESKHSSQCTE